MPSVPGYLWSLWYFQESTQGTAPTTVQYKALAQKASVEIFPNSPPNVAELSGSPDNSSFGPGVPKSNATITIKPSGANGLQFIEDFISSDNSFTLICKQGSVFQVLKGCMVKNTEGNVKLYPDPTPLEVTLDIEYWNMTATEPSGATYESIPTSFINYTDVVLKLDAGGTASTIITDWWDIQFRVENDIFREPSASGATTKLSRGRRKCSITISRALLDSGLTDHNAEVNATAYSASISMVSTTFTFTNGAFNGTGFTHPLTDLSGRKQTLMAGTFSVA